MAGSGFHILKGTHPITPIMLGDAALANRFADAMLEKGVYVVDFPTPSCPGQGHRTQSRRYAGDVIRYRRIPARRRLS